LAASRSKFSMVNFIHPQRGPQPPVVVLMTPLPETTRGIQKLEGVYSIRLES